MEVTSINGSDRSRSGLRATSTEKIEFRKTSQDPHEEFRQRMWQEAEKYLSKQAMRTVEVEEELVAEPVVEKPTPPRFDSEYHLDMYV